MRHLRCFLWSASLVFACSALSVKSAPPAGQPLANARGSEVPPLANARGSETARQLWEEGQAAMKSGEVNKAVAYYERALAADPRDVRTHLSLAAALIGRGDDSAACSHLAVYVRAYPEQLPMRVHYAELLYRLHRPESAKVEFQRIIADAQDDVMPAEEEMLQCHTRLMEIAEAEGDDYGEHLHRGIGVYYLARKREALADAECKLSTESLLCQAAGELALARLERPEEARAYWYLYEVWKKLGQHRPALKNLRLAEERAAFSALTAGERRGLYLAGVELATKTELRR